MRVRERLASGQAWAKQYQDGSVGHEGCEFRKTPYISDLDESRPFYCQCDTELVLPGKPIPPDLRPVPDSD